MVHVEITEAEVALALKNRFKGEEVKLLKWKLISFNEEGKLGYLGDHYRVETTVQKNGKEENVSFFVKTIPQNKTQQDLVEACAMHRKEADFYNSVADELISIVAKVTPMVPDSRVFVLPRCYFANDIMLFMENLIEDGFKGKSADIPLSVEDFCTSMRALGRFHAASIALEERLGKPLIQEYPALEYETFLNDDPDHHLKTWHAASLDAATTLVSMLDKYKNQPEVVKKTQDALPGLMREVMAKVKSWPDTRNVFCHGDLWTNNLLFRLDKEERPIEAVLVDFQLLRYAPPATDIIMFLAFSADKAFRDKHTDTVVRAYHDELKRSLHDLGINVDDVLPWEELQRTIKVAWKSGLMLMASEYPLALAPSSLMDPILSDNEKYKQHFLVNRTPFAVNLFKNYETFRYRYTEALEELIDNYIMKS